MITYAQPTLLSKTTVNIRWWTLLGFVTTILVACFFNFYGLDKEGYANLYYAAAVKSMMLDPRAFFFNSLDTGLFVTVDKPPLGLWTQVVSAWIFGYSGWAILLPQALAGVLSVAVLYVLVHRVWGAKAAFIAALVLAVSPISVAANRNNTMDSQLVFVLLLAALAISYAVERGQLRWALMSFALIGVGFNIKMLQAFMVLPALYLVYLVAARTAWWKRLIHLGAATALMLVISFAWIIVVDLTPTDQRPFIGSSTNNTMMELVADHNGSKRLGIMAGLFNGGVAPSNPAQPNGQTQPNQPRPQNGQPNEPFNPPNGQQPLPPQNGGQPNRPPLPPNGQPPINGGAPNGVPNADGAQPPNAPAQPGGDETGTIGIFRLFNQQLAGQNSWLLPLALLSMVLGLFAARLNWQLDLKHVSVLWWGAWLVPQVIFFSFAGLFHRYYLEMLSPAIAALVAIGFATLWNAWNENNWRGWLLPLALIVGAGGSVFILARYYGDWSKWLTPLIVGITLVSVVGVIAISIFRYPNQFVRGAIIAVGLVALLIAPTVWASTPLAGADTSLPFAGPELLNRPGRAQPVSVDPQQLEYLQANRGDTKFLLAVLSAREAAPFIITTGEAVMALGGFSGRDDILSPSELAERVAKNDVRFFWVSRLNRNAPNANQDNNDLVAWVNTNCRAVSNASSARAGQPSADLQLFDCKK